MQCTDGECTVHDAAHCMTLTASGHCLSPLEQATPRWPRLGRCTENKVRMASQERLHTFWMMVPVSMRRPPGAAGREAPWAGWAAGALLACAFEGLFFFGGESGSSVAINKQVRSASRWYQTLSTPQAKAGGQATLKASASHSSQGKTCTAIATLHVLLHEGASPC